MAGPKYLTGDSAGIKEFLDKFDVSIKNDPAEPRDANQDVHRSFCSIAMVCRSCLLFDDRRQRLRLGQDHAVFIQIMRYPRLAANRTCTD